VSDQPQDDAAQRRDERRRVAEGRLRALVYRADRTAEQEATFTEQRIDVIVNMMADGKWVMGQSDRALAEVWGCSRARIQQLAAEANRLIRRMYRESPRARKQLLARGLQTFERLCNKAEEIGSANGLRVALDAQVQFLTFLGVKPAQKNEHAGPGGKPLEHAQVLILPPKDAEEDEAPGDVGDPAAQG
jgi:hypothetical protein